MADSPLRQDWDVVSWALSGDYNEERPVLIDADNPARHLSKRKAAEHVAQIAGSFDSESTVCVHLFNDVLYPILVLGILASGCEWTGTNPAYTSAELSHHFSATQTKYVITDAMYLDVVVAAIASSEREIEIVLFTDVLTEQPLLRHCSAYRTLPDILARSDASMTRATNNIIPPDRPAVLMSTSGTTGKPKMVSRSHRSLVTETRGTQDNDFAKSYPIRRLYCSPVFHAFSFPEMVINSLRLGYPSYYMRRFDRTFVHKVEEFGITETMGAPAMLLRITEQCEKDDMARLKLQNLRKVLCAGAPLSNHVRSNFLQLFAENSMSIVQVWGMTEGGWFATFRYPEHDDTGSVGRPLDGYRVAMSPSAEVVLSSGKRAGELLVKGYEPTTLYKGSPDATRECFGVDGWLRTGDVGFVEDGKVYLVDRAKDIIKVNGWTVSPSELEAVLFQMPEIAEAAALSCGQGTEEHAAIFVVAKVPALSVASIMDFMMEQVARFKIATCEIRLVPSLPRSPSGKILAMTCG